jgi:hypothetical protein
MTRPPPRDFIPIDLVAGRPTGEASEAPAPGSETASPPPFAVREADEDWSERTSLFGDPGG